MKGPAKRSNSDKELLLWAYTQMLRARANDNRSILLYKQNRCHFQISCAGHEAVQVAAAHVFRPGLDWFYPYYRDMALCAALGMTDYEFMLNALNKQDDPNSHGRMMPMHFGHKKLRIVNQSSPTGSQFLQAVGCALAAKLSGEKSVTYVSAGEGACAQGDFHEALNWAARDKIPVVFLIENNQYAISVHISEQLADKSVAKLVSGYTGLNTVCIDGTDFHESLEAFNHAHLRGLNGEGASLIEANVPRLLSHSISDNHLKYRNQGDLAKEQKLCPIMRMRSELLGRKLSTASELDKIAAEIEEQVLKASEEAEKALDCDPLSAEQFVYQNPVPQTAFTESPASGQESFLVDAINHCLHEELSNDPKVIVFGQDVAHGKGGVFGVTSGLTAEFGVERVFNAQLAESSIIGVAIGLATAGFKPVVEIQFADYIWTAANQIRNELAMMLYRSGGDFACPVVVRIPVGGYIHGGLYHSQNIEGTFAHFPGLHIVYPSNAGDAKGLLRAAIRGSDPVLFLEHKGLYRQPSAKSLEGDSQHVVPIGKAKVLAEGQDITVVTWGAIVQRVLEARSQFEASGISVEVIDLRSIVPLDLETIFNSVKKTHKLLIAHEDVVFMGLGAEIAAAVAKECFTYLDAPVCRIGMKNVSGVAHSSDIEKVVLPQLGDITRAIQELVNF